MQAACKAAPFSGQRVRHCVDLLEEAPRLRHEVLALAGEPHVARTAHHEVDAQQRSSFLSRIDSAGGVTLSERAAALSDPVRSSASMKRRSSSVIIQFYLRNISCQFKHSLCCVGYSAPWRRPTFRVPCCSTS